NFGHISIAEFTPNHVREWMYSLPDTSSKTINNALIPLRAIFQDAFEDGLIDKNPLARIRNLPVRTKEPNPFTRLEMEKILSECQGQFHHLIKFAFWTGLRTSELIGLKWKNVNLVSGIAHVRTVITREGEKNRP